MSIHSKQFSSLPHRCIRCEQVVEHGYWVDDTMDEHPFLSSRNHYANCGLICHQAELSLRKAEKDGYHQGMNCAKCVRDKKKKK